MRRLMWSGVWGVALLAVGCGSPPRAVPSPAAEEFARLEAGARNAHSRGELSYAVDLYKGLLTEAERSDDPSKIGDSAYNLAVCQIALGEWDAAREMFILAEYELERCAEPLAQVMIARARLELFAGRLEASELAARAAIEDARSRPSSRERSDAHVLLGLVALRGGDLDRAEKELEQAGEASDDEQCMPSRYRLQARLHLARGRYGEAAEAFDAEASSARLLSRHAVMADALEFAGDAWQAADRLELAHDRWLRAARVRLAQATGRGVNSRTTLRELEAAARLCARFDDEPLLATDPSLRSRLRYLVERIDDERQRIEQAARGVSGGR